MSLVKVDLFKAGIDAKLGQNRKLMQFVEQESAEGLQVGTFQVVTNTYVGDATVIAAGQAIPLSDLTQEKTPVKFEKIGKGVAVTDEDRRQAFGDPVANAENQTVQAIDGKAEAKVATAMKGAKFSIEVLALDSEAILGAIEVMGEGIEDAPYFLAVHPSVYAGLQKEMGADFNLNNNPFGATIVMSSRLDNDEAYLIQEGALKEIIQKDTDVEVARNASKKQDEIYTDKIHAVYIQDQAKLVKIVVAGE